MSARWGEIGGDRGHLEDGEEGVHLVVEGDDAEVRVGVIRVGGAVLLERIPGSGRGASVGAREGFGMKETGESVPLRRLPRPLKGDVVGEATHVARVDAGRVVPADRLEVALASKGGMAAHEALGLEELVIGGVVAAVTEHAGEERHAKDA